MRKPVIQEVLLGALIMLVSLMLARGLLEVQGTQRSELRRLYATGTAEVGGFMQSLFESTQTASQRADYMHRYGGRTVSARTLAITRQANRAAFMGVSDTAGRLLAHDGKVPTGELQPLIGQALASPSGLAIGEVNHGVVPLAIAFPVDGTRRVLLQGSPFAALSQFLQQVLKQLPLRGSSAAIIDRSGVVLAGIHQPTKIGQRLAPVKRTVLARRPNGTANGHFYVTQPILGGAWRVILVVSESELYQPVSGLAFFFPWLVVSAVIALMCASYLLLLRSSRQSKQLAASLERTQNLVIDLEQLASATSHDIRGSLRRIIAFTSILSREYGDRLDERGTDYMKRIMRSGKHLDTLTAELVEYARAGDRIGPRRPLDTKSVIHDALELLGQEDADVRTTAALPPIYGNQTAMKQVFQNLIANALKFHRPGVPAQVEISGYRRGNVTYITVRDNGIGIEPRYRERVFEPFKRLNGTDYPGTGIGLALVKRILERHGGTIRIKDNPGPGTTVEFTLPTENNTPTRDANRRGD